jgi:hypothetical protein
MPETIISDASYFILLTNIEELDKRNSEVRIFGYRNDSNIYLREIGEM